MFINMLNISVEWATSKPKLFDDNSNGGFTYFQLHSLQPRRETLVQACCECQYPLN